LEGVDDRATYGCDPASPTSAATPAARVTEAPTLVGPVAVVAGVVLVAAGAAGGLLIGRSGSSERTEASPSAQTAPTTAAPPETLSDAELVETYGDAVWRVDVEGCGSTGSGSAFAIDARHLVTNAHVVGIDPTPTLTNRHGRSVDGQVIWVSNEPDVAVIEVSGELEPTLTWAPTDELTEGDHLLALGYPLPAADFSATPGSIVSFQTIGGQREAIRTDAATDRGSSGGPALTEEGGVAGVVTLMDANPDGFQFVPVLFTEAALGKDVERFIAAPSNPEPDCSWVQDELPPLPDWPDWHDDLPVPELEPPPVELPEGEPGIPVPGPTTTAPPCPTGAPIATITEFSATTYDPTWVPAWYDVVVRGTVTNNATATVHIWDVSVDMAASPTTTALGFTGVTVLRPGESATFEATTYAESSGEPTPGGTTISWDWEDVEHWGCGTS
jgi:hypothetical protein